jgi:hypothetical protein
MPEGVDAINGLRELARSQISIELDEFHRAADQQCGQQGDNKKPQENGTLFFPLNFSR